VCERERNHEHESVIIALSEHVTELNITQHK